MLHGVHAVLEAWNALGGAVQHIHEIYQYGMNLREKITYSIYQVIGW